MSVWIIGGGGHAKVLIAALRASGREAAGILDDDTAKHGTTLMGVPVVGKPEDLLSGAEVILAVGDNAARKRIAESLPGARWTTVVHPDAVVHSSVVLGEGTVIFAGAVIQPDSRLGVHTIVNTGATVDHDSELADYVHIAPGVHLAGNVRLGEGAFFGIGAVAIPGVTVGAWTTVGAGAAVVSDLPSGITAAGVPARPLSS